MDEAIALVKQVIQGLKYRGYESLIFAEILSLMRRLKEMQKEKEL